jgi:hypothetical protein
MLKCSERRRALVQLSPISLAYRERKLRCMVLTVISTKQPELRLSEKTSAQLEKSLILMWLSETLLLRHRDVMRGRAVVAEEKEEGDVEEEGKEEVCIHIHIYENIYIYIYVCLHVFIYKYKNIPVYSYTY